MARKSKAQMALQVAEIATAAQWRVGAYLRLSVENSGGKTEDTTENQRAAVLALIATQYNMSLHDFYCDNGETGTNFDRPAFDRMMADLRSGVINCVVVKDLSRFGRNYLEAGTLLEQTFPAMGVRFVAIQDGFDTQNAKRSAEGYIIPQRNILNDIYAKDISLKTGSALRVKQQPRSLNFVTMATLAPTLTDPPCSVCWRRRGAATSTALWSRTYPGLAETTSRWAIFWKRCCPFWACALSR